MISQGFIRYSVPRAAASRNSENLNAFLVVFQWESQKMLQNHQNASGLIRVVVVVSSRRKTLFANSFGVFEGRDSASRIS